MAGRGIDRLGMAGGRPITPAVVRRTEVRAAFQNLARNFDVRQARIVALLLPPAPRVFGNAAGLRRVGLVLRRVPIGRPFPDIADHVVQAVAIRRKGRYGRGALVAIDVQILAWKLALPGVGHVLAAGRELIAPGELRAVEPAARGEFPLGLGRQILARPSGIGERIGKGDVHDGMIVEHVDAALRPIGMAPVSTLHERPPLAPVAQIRHGLPRREHQRAGVKHVRQRARIILRVRRDFRGRDMAGRLDEFLELPVRHRRAVDPEGINRRAVERRLLGVMIVGAHAEGAAGNCGHVAGPVRRHVVLPGAGPQQRHGVHSRCAQLRTNVPEALRPARIGAATLTSRYHHCRSHFQALSCLPAASLTRAARISVSTSSLFKSRPGMEHSIPALKINLELIANPSGF